MMLKDKVAVVTGGGRGSAHARSATPPSGLGSPPHQLLKSSPLMSAPPSRGMMLPVM